MNQETKDKLRAIPWASVDDHIDWRLDLFVYGVGFIMVKDGRKHRTDPRLIIKDIGPSGTTIYQLGPEDLL